MLIASSVIHPVLVVMLALLLIMLFAIVFFNKNTNNNHATGGESMLFNIKAFSITAAIMWGGSIFFMTWWVLAFGSPGHVAQLENWLGLAYMGYTVSPLGSIIGLFWGAIDGGIAAFFFSWIYNSLSKRLT